jgi:ferritin heavy chain
VALPGLHWYFKKNSDEEREHAMKFMKYLNKRGGRIVLQDIKNPEKVEFSTAVEAMTQALELEKRVNEVNYRVSRNIGFLILGNLPELTRSSRYRC